MNYLTINHRKHHLPPLFMVFLTAVPLTSQAASLPFSVTTSEQTVSDCHSNGVIRGQQGKNCVKSKSTTSVTSPLISVNLDAAGANQQSGCQAAGIHLSGNGQVKISGFNNCIDKIQSSGNNTLSFNASVHCKFEHLSMDANGKVTVTANSSCLNNEKTDLPTGFQRLGSISQLSHQLINPPNIQNFNADNSIILMGVPSTKGWQPGVAQLIQDGNGIIQVGFTEWDYLDGHHLTEHVDYAILDKGCHLNDNQNSFAVGSFDLDMAGDQVLSAGNWKLIKPDCSSAKLTSVFMTIQVNQDAPLVVRARNILNNSFEAALFQDKALTRGNHERNGSFTIGYVAFYGDPKNETVTVNDKKTKLSIEAIEVNHEWTPVDGFSSKQQIRLQEDRNPLGNYPLETRHKFETVKVLNLGNKLFAQDITFNGKQPFVLRRR